MYLTEKFFNPTFGIVDFKKISSDSVVISILLHENKQTKIVWHVI